MIEAKKNYRVKTSPPLREEISATTVYACKIGARRIIISVSSTLTPSPSLAHSPPEMQYLCRGCTTISNDDDDDGAYRLASNRYTERRNCTSEQFHVTGHWERTLRPFYNATTNRIARRTYTPRPVQHPGYYLPILLLPNAPPLMIYRLNEQ